MFPELDGTFPNHPADPLQPANQRDLRARVMSGGFDIGLAFDGDADRVFVVDEAGHGLSGSTTTAILAAAVLRSDPGATVLYNLICSRAVPETIREHGGIPVRTKVGHSYIKQIMLDTGAIFGGEHSAHYYFARNYRADSGLIASLLVINELSRSSVDLSVLRKPFERYAASGEINTHVDDVAAVIDDVSEEYSKYSQDRLDGLTVDCGSWWFNLRPSNTEPLLRLNLEAADTRRLRRPCGRVALAHHPQLRRTSMTLSPKLLEILACPEDKGPLYYVESEDLLYNPRLKRRYDVRDDIPVMLIDESVTVDDAEHARLMGVIERDAIAPTFTV